EAVLGRHPEVREAAVLVFGESPSDKQLAAYVVARPGYAPSQEQLRHFLESQLPNYMLPSAFVLLERFPLNPNGKLDRRALPVPDIADAKQGTISIAARNPIEELLIAQWAEMLGVEQIGIHDNFFELGGHSLLATQAVSRLYKMFHIELPLRTFFEASTISAIAGHITNMVAKELQAPALMQVSRPAKLPLSFAQQRLWFLHQLEQASTLYNIRAALSLQGNFHAKAFERSLQEIVQRHESLRTTFSAVDGLPQQHIATTLTLPRPVVDLQSLTGAGQQVEVQRLALQQAEIPFDLARGPLLRVTLLRLAPQEHILLLTIHHIVFDEWSLEVFGRELSKLYNAYVQGEPSPLPELPVQYADFVLWQREWLQGHALQAHLDYWQEQLRGAPAVLPLPTDRPRPARQTFHGGTVSFNLSPELSQELKTLSLREGSTLFMTLLAAFTILLARYSGQDDIVVGSPIANRTRVEMENLIGFFVNTLVLRTDISGNATFQEILHRVREVALEAYAHQNLPFEKLVEEISPERDLSRNPLFQIMFVLQHVSESVFDLADLTLRPIPVEVGTTQFDLTLSLLDGTQGLEGQFSYNSDLFEASTIARMATHFQLLLQGIVISPRQHIGMLPLLTAAERQQQLVTWNATQTAYPQEICLHELVEAQVARSPDRIAVVFEEHHLSYASLNERANQLAHHLQQLGVGPEMCVGVCLHRSLELVVSLLAILKAGGAYLPLEPTYPPERLRWLLQDSQVRVLLTQSTWLTLLMPLSTPVLCLDEQDWIGRDEQDRHNPCSGVGAQNQAYVIYTSGSTGQPKGVSNTHQGICNRLLWMQDSYGLSADDRVMQKTPFGFDVSVWEFFWPLLSGACLVVARPEGHRESAYLLQLIEFEQISTLHFVPSMLSAVLEEPGWERCQSLHQVICSGEELSSTVQQRFFACCQAELSNLYGPTEAAIDVTCWKCQRDDVRQLVPIGQPIANIEVYVLDRHLQLVPIGVAGELYLGGIGLARGYLNRPELTAERFIPHPFPDIPGARLYKTGDLARYLADGRLEFLGRNDTQVKIRGYRIELGEIEAMLTRHMLIREAVVMAHEDARGDLTLVAYVVPHEGYRPAQTELRSFMQSKLPDYMIPPIFVYLDKLPLTPHGKVDRRALPTSTEREAEAARNAAPARTPVEEMLTGLWSELLGLKRTGIHDNFFELGGHSLLAIQVISRIRSLLLVEIPVRTLFEFPTVAGLARQIEQALRGEPRIESPALVPVARPQDLPLSFAQQRLWFLEQLQPGNTAYNIPLAFHIRGMLNMQALEQSIEHTVQRHEILRTTFHTQQGRPVQIIAPTANMYLSLADLSSLSPEQREAEVHRLTSQEALEPFDLTHGPLLRVTLLELCRDEQVLLLSMHHIVTDEWSVDIFLGELNALYQVFSQEEPSPLPELPLQYADYALWQRHMLQGDALHNQLHYWQEQLRSMPAALNLPTDYPRPALQTFQGASYAIKLSEGLSEALKMLSLREGVTLFMTLLAAFQVLLARYSGQEDIVVGSPVANRTYLELEGLIGFFVNTLVLRTDLSGNPPFEEVLERVRESALGAYTHQGLPFEQLVDLLQPARDLSRNPLFQVLFVLQQAARSSRRLADLTLDALPTEIEKTKFDLALTLAEDSEGIEGSFSYNSDLFEA
ncbi:MAG TPA: amino acid adenylation domain-containing protein, partial [Ktedonobacteraceae bacterium]|nr:amino acid adenylation domain-containing protein [Ktedonobacteraceae bacterium]